MLISASFFDLEAWWGHVIEAALVNSVGEVVFHSYVRPQIIPHSYWLKNKGIGLNDLLQASPWGEVVSELQVLMRERHVVFHKKEHDLSFFPNVAKAQWTSHCSMERFAPYVGPWRFDYGTYPFKGLPEIMQSFGWRYADPGAHRAIPDCLAARRLWQWLDNNPLPTIELPGEIGSINQAVWS